MGMPHSQTVSVVCWRNVDQSEHQVDFQRQLYHAYSTSNHWSDLEIVMGYRYKWRSDEDSTCQGQVDWVDIKDERLADVKDG